MHPRELQNPAHPGALNPDWELSGLGAARLGDPFWGWIEKNFEVRGYSYLQRNFRGVLSKARRGACKEEVRRKETIAPYDKPAPH